MIEALRQQGSRDLAVISPAQGLRLTYGELGARIEQVAEWLVGTAGERRLVFLAPGPDLEAVLLYLGCLQANLPLCLVEPQAEPMARLVRVYRPALVLAPATLQPVEGGRAATPPVPGYAATVAAPLPEQEIHPDLALLLTTSGSTGSPKLVRLAMKNLEANASAIAQYLGLGPGERAIQSLPIYYSYGLSVVNSHLLSGSSLVVTPHSFMRPEFWRDLEEERATSFAGVPYMYETLHRLRFEPARQPSLRTLTQAGGALRRELIAHFHRKTAEAGGRLFVMYGQTEATARISYVPPERLGDKIGAIGVPIPGGRLRLEPIEVGGGPAAELVYEGRNVMMGYAESPGDLALGDIQGGVLRTGDLGTVDEEGYFSVVGRLKRFAKLFGRRVSLEDVERELESAFPVRAIATDGGERLCLQVAVDGGVGDQALSAHLARFLAVPPSAITIHRVAELPLTATGKKDYRAAEAR